MLSKFIMLELLVVSTVAFLASLLTLFSGFGLGTLLMPVVALFFPLEVAIGMTAIVHLANNLFKVALLGRHAVASVLLRFGLPAVLAAFAGAWVLGLLVENSAVLTYIVFDFRMQTTWLKIIVGVLILTFVVLEYSKRFSEIKLRPKFLPLGGVISGFFGGLSGHQGAFRSMFLLKAGLTKEQFVATGIMVAVMVDMARLMVYGKDLAAKATSIDWVLVSSATSAAFFGAYLGKKLLDKVTIDVVHYMVSVLLVVVAVGLIVGLI